MDVRGDDATALSKPMSAFKASERSIAAQKLVVGAQCTYGFTIGSMRLRAM